MHHQSSTHRGQLKLTPTGHLRRAHRPLRFSQLRGEATGGLSANSCGSRRGAPPAGLADQQALLSTENPQSHGVGSWQWGWWQGWCVPGCVGGDIHSFWSRGGHT